MAEELAMMPVHLSGHLHALWHNVLEQQEDGDLSQWSNKLIAQMAMFQGDPEGFVELLKKYRWIDHETNCIHDWLDYAGTYLRNKYHDKDQRLLKAIWARYGKHYGKRTSPGNKKGRDFTHKSHPKMVLPNLTIPNHTIPDQTKEAGFALPDFVNKQNWEDFRKMRNKIGKPMTDRAVQLIWKQLEKLQSDGYDPNACLDQSIRNCWQDVYPLKDYRSDRGNGAGQRSTKTDEQRAKVAAALRQGLDDET